MNKPQRTQRAQRTSSCSVSSVHSVVCSCSCHHRRSSSSSWSRRLVLLGSSENLMALLIPCRALVALALITWAAATVGAQPRAPRNPGDTLHSPVIGERGVVTFQLYAPK